MSILFGFLHFNSDGTTCLSPYRVPVRGLIQAFEESQLEQEIEIDTDCANDKVTRRLNNQNSGRACIKERTV